MEQDIRYGVFNYPNAVFTTSPISCERFENAQINFRGREIPSGITGPSSIVPNVLLLKANNGSDFCTSRNVGYYFCLVLNSGPRNRGIDTIICVVLGPSGRIFLDPALYLIVDFIADGIKVLKNIFLGKTHFFQAPLFEEFGPCLDISQGFFIRFLPVNHIDDQLGFDAVKGDDIIVKDLESAPLDGMVTKEGEPESFFRSGHVLAKFFCLLL